MSLCLLDFIAIANSQHQQTLNISRADSIRNMSAGTFRLGIRLFSGPQATISRCADSSSTTILFSRRSIVSLAYTARASKRPSLSKEPQSPLTSTIGPSFFTPSLCRTPAKRCASTEAQPIQANPQQKPNNAVLDWNSFFQLRKSRRRYILVSNIITSLATTGTTIGFLSTQPELADEITKLAPIDPAISLGILTFATALFGWLIGPFFGNALWGMFHRARLPEFTLKEKVFFQRIRKHRVNPMGASANNPVPDFYGEKIGSTSGYRRWMKDQRAFNRKKEGNYAGTA